MSRTPVALLPALVLPLRALGQEAGEAPGPLGAVEVSLAEKVPLYLVTWDNGDGSVVHGLDGILVASVTNLGDAPVALRNLGVHGLRWVDPATGESFVVVHPCECAVLLGAAPAGTPIGVVLRVDPGQTSSFALEDFGCNAPWAPPRQGTWSLTFRLLPAEADIPIPAGRPDFSLLSPRCRDRLLEDSFWTGSHASPALVVTLGPPRRVKVK